MALRAIHTTVHSVGLMSAGLRALATCLSRTSSMSATRCLASTPAAAANDAVMEAWLPVEHRFLAAHSGPRR